MMRFIKVFALGLLALAPSAYVQAELFAAMSGPSNFPCHHHTVPERTPLLPGQRCCSVAHGSPAQVTIRFENLHASDLPRQMVGSATGDLMDRISFVESCESTSPPGASPLRI